MNKFLLKDRKDSMKFEEDWKHHLTLNCLV